MKSSKLMFSLFICNVLIATGLCLLGSYKTSAQSLTYISKIFKGPNQPNLDYRSSISNVFKVGNSIIAVSRESIWKTDGTSGGTIKLFSSNKGETFEIIVCDSRNVTDDVRSKSDRLEDKLENGSYRFEKNGHFFFWTYNPNGNMNLWSSDGTVQGTQPLKGVLPLEIRSPSVFYMDLNKFYVTSSVYNNSEKNKR